MPLRRWAVGWLLLLASLLSAVGCSTPATPTVAPSTSVAGATPTPPVPTPSGVGFANPNPTIPPGTAWSVGRYPISITGQTMAWNSQAFGFETVEQFTVKGTLTIGRDASGWPTLAVEGTPGDDAVGTFIFASDTKLLAALLGSDPNDGREIAIGQIVGDPDLGMSASVNFSAAPLYKGVTFQPRTGSQTAAVAPAPIVGGYLSAQVINGRANGMIDVLGATGVSDPLYYRYLAMFSG